MATTGMTAMPSGAMARAESMGPSLRQVRLLSPWYGNFFEALIVHLTCLKLTAGLTTSNSVRD